MEHLTSLEKLVHKTYRCNSDKDAESQASFGEIDENALDLLALLDTYEIIVCMKTEKKSHPQNQFRDCVEAFQLDHSVDNIQSTMKLM